MVSHAQLRRRRVYGAISVVLGLLLVTLGVFAYLGKLGASSPDAVASRGAANGTAATTAPSVDPDIKAPLTVVNASSSAGLAARGRDAFEGAGWEVAEIGNYTAQVSASVIYYPADNPTAKAAAINLQLAFPKITKLAVSPATFPYTGVVVVMTGDWDPGGG